MNRVVYNYLKNITADNIVEEYENCCVIYWDDFLNFFYGFKIYKCISSDRIVDVLKGMRLNPFDILRDKVFVEMFDNEITELLQEASYDVPLIVSYYLEEHDKQQKIFLPKSFTHEISIKVLEDYLNVEHINGNYLQLIRDCRSSSELNLSPKLRKKARERLNALWNDPNINFITHTFGANVTFGHFFEEVSCKFEKGILYSEYDMNWIVNNKDYSTLLNNFIYLFGYVDKHMRCRLTARKSDMGIIETIFSLHGKGMYQKGTAFDTFNMLADAQMTGYVNELRKLGVDIENVIKWFYEDYLAEEFEAREFICNVPKASDSILSKCKALPSAFDGIIKQFKMYCEDGEVDRELFRYNTDSPRLKDVPSLIKNKYCYIANSDLDKEIYFVFSDQSMLKYTERTKSKYNTFFKLILNEEITLEECQSYNKEALDWLKKRNVIYTDKGIIKFNTERLYLLKEFYENEVISLQHIESKMLKDFILQGDVVVESTLLSRQECQYFDYLLNNSEYSNGMALRNRYIHDSIINDEKRQQQDYNTFLKIMIILIIKMNDDFCLREQVMQEGDFYEL